MNQLVSNPTADCQGEGWSRGRLRTVGAVALTAAGVYFCYRLTQPCIPSLVWAGALALIFTPMHGRIEAKVRRPNLAAGISLMIIGSLVIAPSTWFAQKLAEQATSVPESIEKQIAAGKWHTADGAHPQIARILTLVERQINETENRSMASTWLKTVISKLIKESAVATVQICLTLYFLFYLLRDRTRVLTDIRSFLPLSQSETHTLFSRVNETIHATLYGMLALSALQAALGGLMYWWLGIPSPCFWALVMALFAFVPVVDTIIIWVPAALYLGLEGRWSEALVIAGLGSLVIRMVINIMYPVVVKNRLKAPSVTIFIALLGGVVLFGWSGLVLGPVILTATGALLEICAKRFAGPEPAAQTTYSRVCRC